MKRHKRIVAALLLTASLAAPGLARADEAIPTSKPPTPVETVMAPAPSNVKISQEGAVAVAKALFQIPDDMGAPNIGFSQSKEYAVWRLEWRTKEKSPEQKSVQVEVDANTGKVRSYGSWSSGGDQKAPLAYTRKEAQKLAEEWLDKLGADQKAALRYREMQNEFLFWGGAQASYTYHWDRMEQGYPVNGDGIDITIDARTGKLQQFNINWRGSDVSFNLPKEIVDKAKAEAAYVPLPLELFYQRFTKPGTDESRWQLIYRPLTGFYPMVSADGKLIDYAGRQIDLDKYADKRVVPMPLVPYRKPAQPLSRDEALKLAQQVSGRKEEPNSSSYSEQGDETKRRVWEFSWQGPDMAKGGDRYTNVRIDVERGIVLNMSNWLPGGYEPLKEGEEPKVTLEEAKNSALSLMLLFRPDLAGSAHLQPTPDETFELKLGARPSTYSFTFIHHHLGIPRSDASSRIEIDARTGEVTHFSSWETSDVKGEFPSTDDVVGKGKALEALLKQQPLQLVWTTIYPVEQGDKAMPERTTPVTVLVWAPVQGNVMGIDAKTGAPLDGQGRDLIEAAKRPTDIEGHFAQREIELLWSRQVFELKDGKFNPSGTLNVAELARWLVLAKGVQPYPMYDFSVAFAGSAKAETVVAELRANNADGYFGAAFQAGILLPEDFADGFDLEAQVTREQLALWAVRAMGYGEIAKMENRIAMSFTDQAEIDAKYANAIAILEGLEIVKGNGAGGFAPKRLLTRGEAAKILFAITMQTRR